MVTARLLARLLNWADARVYSCDQCGVYQALDDAVERTGADGAESLICEACFIENTRNGARLE